MKGLPQGSPHQPTRRPVGPRDARDGPARSQTRRSRWRWRRCCTTSASRAPWAGRRTATRFYHHEHVGARMAEELCWRLKLSTAERKRIVWLVEKHQYLADARQLQAEQAEGNAQPSRHRRAVGAAPCRCAGERPGQRSRDVLRGAAGANGRDADLIAAAAVDGRRSQAARPGAGAAVQDAARRGARGAARWHDRQRGGGVGTGGAFAVGAWWARWLQ